MAQFRITIGVAPEDTLFQKDLIAAFPDFELHFVKLIAGRSMLLTFCQSTEFNAKTSLDKKREEEACRALQPALAAEIRNKLEYLRGERSRVDPNSSAQFLDTATSR